MELTSSLILDIILFAILLGIVWRAWQAGFVSAFISLVGSLAGYLGAALLSGPISQQLYTVFVQKHVLNYVTDKLPQTVGGVPLENLGQVAGLAGFQDQAISIISQALENLNLDLAFLTGKDTETAAQGIFGKVTQEGTGVAQAVTEVVVGPAVEFVLRTVVFFILFLLIMFVVRLLVGLGKGFNHVPLVGGINRLMGLGLGLVNAAVVGYLITMALVLVVAVSGNKWEFLNSSVLEEARLLMWFKHLDLMSIFS